MISIVIVEYHSLEDIKSCIASIRHSGISEKEAEIILSSNSCYPPKKKRSSPPGTHRSNLAVQ
ncbi:MAG: hypothetical protein LUE93_01475 [Bacteroides sp.]|nr:hypothetical protein [Bacteroides sp.]